MSNRQCVSELWPIAFASFLGTPPQKNIQENLHSLIKQLFVNLNKYFIYFINCHLL